MQLGVLAPPPLNRWSIDLELISMLLIGKKTTKNESGGCISQESNQHTSHLSYLYPSIQPQALSITHRWTGPLTKPWRHYTSNESKITAKCPSAQKFWKKAAGLSAWIIHNSNEKCWLNIEEWHGVYWKKRLLSVENCRRIFFGRVYDLHM